MPCKYLSSPITTVTVILFFRIGSFVMFLSTLLLGIFMFILLLVVSQTWYLFNRLSVYTDAKFLV